MNKLPVDSVGDPGVRNQLSSVRVSRNLQRNPSLGSHCRTVRRMGDEQARPASIDLQCRQHRTQMLCVRRIAISNANQLQSIELDFLLIEDSHSCFANCFQVRPRISELFVIALGKISTEWNLEALKRRCRPLDVNRCPIKQISGNNRQVRLLSIYARDNSPQESPAAHVP